MEKISLFNARKRKNMKMKDVAKQLNITRQTLYNWETGKTLPRIDYIRTLATLYEVEESAFILSSHTS